MDRIIVGIDGGGTHTTLAVSNKEGCLLGLVQGEALNFNTIGMDTFRTHLRRALDEVERRYGPIEALSLGHSALDDEPSPQLAAEIMGDVFDVSRCYIHSDVFMAAHGGHAGRTGCCSGCRHGRHGGRHGRPGCAACPWGLGIPFRRRGQRVFPGAPGDGSCGRGL